MKNPKTFLVFVSFLGTVAAQSPLNVTEVNYTDPYDGNFSLRGYVSIPKITPAPAVVIIPDRNNNDDYEQRRATMIADEFGWVGFAADIYGADYVDNSTIRRQNAGLYRGNDSLFVGRIQSAIDVLKNHPDVLSDKIAIIGYCFGGTGVFTYSFLSTNINDIVGAVSFHGGLTDFSVSGPMQHPILVLSGGDDDTGTEMEELEEKLDLANSTWQITRYAGIQHAFTVWTDRRYNERVDKRSWREMGTFLKERFDEISYENQPPSPTKVEPINYTDTDGFALRGYLAKPTDAKAGETPAVVILPQWSGTVGTDGLISQRATLLAELGYVGFGADIYGTEYVKVEDFNKRIELATLYHTNYTLFVSRIKAAVSVVTNHELVNPDKIALIGYCFGGTGVINYAFEGLDNVKVVVPFHGGLTSLAPVQTDDIYPYVLVQSGGIDDAHGNNTELEMQLDKANATWEITRYSGVNHGFADWSLPAYDSLADWRSWDSMLGVFELELLSDSDQEDGDEDEDEDGDEDGDEDEEDEEDEDEEDEEDEDEEDEEDEDEEDEEDEDEEDEEDEDEEDEDEEDEEEEGEETINTTLSNTNERDVTSGSLSLLIYYPFAKYFSLFASIAIFLPQL